MYGHAYEIMTRTVFFVSSSSSSKPIERAQNEQQQQPTSNEIEITNNQSSMYV